MIAYFIGGPQDLTKKVVDDKMETFEFPTRDLTNFFPTGEMRPTPVVQTAKYRIVHHRLMDLFYIYHYEGTW